LIIMFRKLKFFLKKTRLELSIAKWRFIKSPIKIERILDVHILIVKKNDYIHLAKICALSFLYFHPSSEVTLHCDSKTFNTAKRKFSHLSDSIKVVLDQSEQISWQEAKLNLFLSLSGTSKILMDADLRWNGTIQELKGITFFCKEFELVQRSPERQLNRVLGISSNSGATMKNTSFIFLANHEISPSDLTLIKKSYFEFQSVLDHADIGILDRPNLTRLSEQIIISLITENWNKTIKFLKETDSHKDGKFVESSYFGATGATF